MKIEATLPLVHEQKHKELWGRGLVRVLNESISRAATVLLRDKLSEDTD